MRRKVVSDQVSYNITQSPRPMGEPCGNRCGRRAFWMNKIGMQDCLDGERDDKTPTGRGMEPGPDYASTSSSCALGNPHKHLGLGHPLRPDNLHTHHRGLNLESATCRINNKRKNCSCDDDFLLKVVLSCTSTTRDCPGDGADPLSHPQFGATDSESFRTASKAWGGVTSIFCSMIMPMV